MNGLQRLPRDEEAAILDLVRANGLDASKLACYMTRQGGEGIGRFKGSTNYFAGRTYRISYDLMLCEYCGNLMPSAVCPAKAQQLKERMKQLNA